MVSRVGLALGANLGQRLMNIRAARDMLRDLVGTQSHYLQAPIYQTEPVDCDRDSELFFNTVIEIDYSGKPDELLKNIHLIEIFLGREADHAYNAPRKIDIDILYFGNTQCDDKELTIPHPRMLERRFVLEPLTQIRPDLVLPGQSAPIAVHHRNLDSVQAPPLLIELTW